ncbi:MAG: hypothetical protein AB1352_04030 [Patescibacteria group bacterium]
MSHSKLFLRVFLLAAAVSVGVIAQQWSVPSGYQKSDFDIQSQALAPRKDCVSASLQGQSVVNGLDHNIAVPRFIDAVRLSYADPGATQYLTRAKDYEIMGFYQERMRGLCWQVAAQSGDQVVFSKGDQAVRIALLPNPSGRSVISYEVLPARSVLGESTVRAAQEDTPPPPPPGDPTTNPPPPTSPPPGDSNPPPPPPPDSSSCSGGQVWCPSSSGSGGWCQMPPCPHPPPPSSGSGSCSGGQVWCTDMSGSGGWCQMPPCPSSTPPPSGSVSCSGGQVWCPSSSGSGGWCQYPPCPSSTPYPAPTSCSGSYQQPGMTTPNCNYSLCPNGCTWTNGCPSGCYTQATCSGEYQQPGSTYPMCNYAKCPSGCYYGSDGCPQSCMGSSSSNQSGSNYAGDANSCPGFAYSRWDSTGKRYCQLNSVRSCDYNYPSYLTNGSNYKPENCPPDNAGSSSTGSCSGGQVWCPSSSGSGGWCQMPPCPSQSGMMYPSCPSTQYMCNGTCVPMNTPCSPSSWPTDSASCTAQGKVWCTPSSGGMGWCQTGPCPSSTPSSSGCPSNQVWCPNTSGSGGWCQMSPCPSMGNSSTCPSGHYWCPQTNSCVGNSQPCTVTNTYQPTPTPAPAVPALKCGQCQVAQEGKCVRAPTGTVDPLCGGGQCDQYGGCVQLGSGKKLVGDGAICGDRWCNIEKGENSENCPAECTNKPKSLSQPSPVPVQPQPTQYPSREGQPWQYQGPYPGGQSSGDQGIYGQQGGGWGEPSEEEQQRRQEEQFKMMKRGMDQFVRGVSEMQKYVNRMKSKLVRLGVSIPPELENALTRAPELVKKIKSAKSVEEVESVVGDMEDVAMVMQDWGPRLGDLERLGNMIKQSDQKIKKMQSALKRAQNAAKKKLELSEPVAELQSLFDVMKQLLGDAKAFAKTDPDAALDKLDEFYGNMEEYWNHVSFVDMLTNMQKGLSQAKNQIAASERKLKSLERAKKLDTETVAYLRAMLTEIKDKVPALQSLLKQRPVDYDEVRSLGEELWDKVQEFENTMALYGQNYYLPIIKGGQGVNFEAPQGFIMQDYTPSVMPQVPMGNEPG